HGAGNLYLIDNGRVTEPPEALVLSLGRIAAETISVMMEQSMQTALTRSYFGTKVLGYSFKQAIFPLGLQRAHTVARWKLCAAWDAGACAGLVFRVFRLLRHAAILPLGAAAPRGKRGRGHRGWPVRRRVLYSSFRRNV